jgi:hypothetical protein
VNSDGVLLGPPQGPRTRTSLRVIIAVAVLAFLGAGVGTAFGMAGNRATGTQTGAGPLNSATATADPTQTATDTTATTDPTADPSLGCPAGCGNGTGNQGGVTQVPVPGVVDTNVTYAQAQLNQAGFKSTTGWSCGGSADPGKVLNQDPRGNSQANKGSTVKLTVQGVKVLDEVGKYWETAKSDLSNAGFKVSVKYNTNGSSSTSVSSQTPAGGSCVQSGSTVTITVNQSAPTTNAPPSQTPGA